MSPSRTLHVKLAQCLRYQDGNTDTARVRPAGESQRHEQPEKHISEALRASGVRQRKTIAIFTLDLRGEALVVEVTGAAQHYRAASVWTAGLGTTGLWLPLSFPPVARAAAMVGNSEHLYFIAGNRIDDGVRKVFHDETAPSVEPQGAQQWVLQQELN